MVPSEGQQSAGGSPAKQWFTTTHSSVVLAAKQGSSPDGAAALELLCRPIGSARMRPSRAGQRFRAHRCGNTKQLNLMNSEPPPRPGKRLALFFDGTWNKPAN